MSDKSDSNIINDKDEQSLKNSLTSDEYQTQMKKTTHDELLKLGEKLSNNKNKEHYIKECIKKKGDILDKYKFNDNEINDYVEEISKNKDLLLLKIHGIVKDLNYIKQVDHKISTYYDKNIILIKNDLDSLTEENELLIKENEELETIIEEDFKKTNQRITNLRSKIMNKNFIIKALCVLLIVSNFHTWIFSNYGIKPYFNIWIIIFKWVGYIIYQCIYLIPNIYKLVTNYTNYVYIYEQSIKIFLSCFETCIYYLSHILKICNGFMIIHIRSGIEWIIENQIKCYSSALGLIMLIFRNYIIK
jgi:hypothetical protein